VIRRKKKGRMGARERPRRPDAACGLWFIILRQAKESARVSIESEEVKKIKRRRGEGQRKK
jgi:hypothetical protein